MASYELFKPTLERAEGGYQNLVNDKGNYNSKKERVGTKYGISAKFYEKVIGRPPSAEDMKGITRFEAHVLFKNEFWDKIKADQIQSQGVAEMIADQAINANPSVATKIVQTSLNKHFGKQLVVDGVVGVKTIEAINSVHWEQLFIKVGQERLEYYENLEDYKYFAKSWDSRVFTLGRKFGVMIKKKRKRRCF
ncbi:putative peptidoglycan binding protein [Tenacibaculum skagerrakense]|uniref:Putative peptidoglycan binding protein n=1 Tax=Tenacibaculum skagerrakense TaxID=186571 RepID=A0A4R2NM62_9FLAO|nr:glycosyl hydrolase 108 family protein [Tenacibaculum skagerrakense]TCP22385.1 putative peptidoglycan binding protein [Tenacibaculum skagerrakense]